MPPRKHEPNGQVFGRWTVTGEATPRGKSRMWRCVCLCGAVDDVYMASLFSGATTSCGCYQRERVVAIQTTHGKSNSPEFRAWAKMIDRCTNPNNPSFGHYGARGVRVCDKWLGSFETFLRDIGSRPSQKHSLERRDNDGNYEPTNCYWGTRLEQANNTTRSRRIEAFGKSQTITQWARETGLTADSIRYRINSGWNAELALSTPHSRATQHGVRLGDESKSSEAPHASLSHVSRPT